MVSGERSAAAATHGYLRGAHSCCQRLRQISKSGTRDMDFFVLLLLLLFCSAPCCLVVFSFIAHFREFIPRVSVQTGGSKHEAQSAGKRILDQTNEREPQAIDRMENGWPKDLIADQQLTPRAFPTREDIDSILPSRLVPKAHA